MVGWLESRAAQTAAAAKAWLTIVAVVELRAGDAGELDRFTVWVVEMARIFVRSEYPNRPRNMLVKVVG